MSNAYVHAERSAKKWGGTPEDYLPIHRWLDQCKAHLADNRHRAILHNSWGIHLAVEVFGDFIANSASRRVFVKEIAEQHVVEDLGFIPSLSECLAGLKLEAWTGGALSNLKQRRAQPRPNRRTNGANRSPLDQSGALFRRCGRSSGERRTNNEQTGTSLFLAIGEPRPSGRLPSETCVPTRSREFDFPYEYPRTRLSWGFGNCVRGAGNRKSNVF